MANFFDQFDATPKPQGSGNFFDQFDEQSDPMMAAPSQPDMSFTDSAIDIAKSVPRGLDKLATTTARGLTELVGSGLETVGATDTADQVRDYAKRRYEENVKAYTDKYGAEAKSLPGQITEGVTQGVGLLSTMPVAGTAGFLPLLSGMSMGQGVEMMDKVAATNAPIEVGTGAAQRQIGANMILGLIPGAGAVKGALVNWATGQASDRWTYDYLVEKGQKKLADSIIGDRRVIDKEGAIDLIVGAFGGRMGVAPEKKKKDKTPDVKIEDEIKNAKVQPDMPPEQVPHGETPDQLAQYRWLAEQQAQAQAFDPADAQGAPIQMTREGQAVPPALDRATAEMDAQQPTMRGGVMGGILDPQTMARMQQEQDMLNDLNNTLPPVERVPTLPQGAEPPLPNAPSLPPEVPLLPGHPNTLELTPMREPGAALPELAGQLRNPQLNPRATGGVLSLMDPSQYPQAPKAPEPPTMDFPLRQEVLQEPRVKAAITRFRKRFAEATTDAARTKVENDFFKFMKQYGATNAPDAAGLRPLFERVMRDPSAIRKSGELNLTKTDTEIPGTPFQRAMRRKGQGGAIHPDLLGVGKASEILSTLGSRALWEMFRGTFTDADMEDMKSLAGPDAYKSKSTAVWMRPTDFLALAHGRDLSSPQGNYRAEEKRAKIRKGIKTPKGLSGQMPFLWIEKDQYGYAKAIGHEGRHRADVMIENGVDWIPVRIEDLSGTRWDTDGNPYHAIIAEGDHTSRSIPFPDKFIWDKPGKYKIEKLQDEARAALKKATQDIEVNEVSQADWLKSQVYRAKVIELVGGVGKKEGGAIDPEVFKEGMKRLTRSLSKLTDSGWVKAKFPSDQYETNGDGTPLIMLHGTTREFSGDLRGSDQGVHLSFIVPAHLIRAPGDMFTRPKRASLEARIEEERIKNLVIGDDLKKSSVKSEKSVAERVAHHAKNIQGMGYNLRPVVLKKGGYPYIDKDIGIWRPLNVMDDLRLELEQIARENGKEPMPEGRWNNYRNKIRDLVMDDINNGTQQANRMFSQFLKEHGIDGIFYKNVGESLNKTTTSSSGHQFLTKIQNARRNHAYEQGQLPPPTSLQHPISFVTWDEKNIESLYVDRPVDTEQLKVWNRKANAMKQGGALRLDEITNGISDLIDRVKPIIRMPSRSMSELAEPDRQRVAASRVPGLSALVDYISKDIPVETMKAKIMEQGDIDNPMHSLIGSKEMIASIKDHPAIYWFGSLFTNARKRGDLYHREFLQPLEKTILKLTQREKGDTLAKIMRAEMFAKKTLDDAALGRIGLSPRETEVYKALRQEFKVALDKLNAYRRSTNQEEITGHDAYLSSRWSGDWKTPVYDTNGKLIWYIAETSKARAEHALKYLKAQYPDLDMSKSKVAYSKNFFMAEESFQLATLTDMIAWLGKDDPAVKAMEEAWKSRMELEGEQVLGHQKHMEPKAGVRGFLGDRPWVSEQKNTRDLLKSQLAYLRNTHTWVELQTAIQEANKILGDKEVQEKAPNLVELLQDVKQNEMGYSTIKWLANGERAASRWLSEGTNLLSKALPSLRNLPTDLGSAHIGMGWGKSFFYLMKLGMFNIPFATMSVIQPLYTIPHHMRLTLDGHEHNLIKTWVGSVYGGTASMKAHFTNDLTGMTPLQREAYKYMRANSIGDLNQYSEAHDIGLPATAKKIKDLGGWSMTESERFARSTAFMSFVSHLDQSGKYKGDQMKMFQKAEELTNKSMANYRHTERAGMFNKTGFTGTAASALQTFKVNQYNQLYDLAKHASTTGDYRPFLSLLAVQWFLAGALGMFGMDEVEDMWNLIKKGAVQLGINDPDFLKWSPKYEISRRLDDWAAYGPFSTTIGQNLNYASRMSAANIVDASFAGIFPFVADTGKQISSVFSLAKDAVAGHDLTESKERAIHATLPASLKSWYEMQSKTLVDAEGNPYPTTKAPTALAYRRTEEDKAAKSKPLVGMQTINEAKTRDKSYRARLSEGLLSEATALQLEKFQQAIRNTNPQAAKEAIQEYVDLGGDWKELLNQTESGQIKRLFTEDEMMALQARSMQAKRKLGRRMDYVR